MNYFDILLTFFLIWPAVSVRKTAEFSSEADILVLAPCRAGKKVECNNAGLGQPNLGATSLVIRKYGSCAGIGMWNDYLVKSSCYTLIWQIKVNNCC